MSIEKGFAISREESIRLIIKTCLENKVTNPDQIAFVLATARHESGNFTHSEEIGGRAQAIKLGYSGGSEYFGRGYVQLTHKENYEKFDRLLGLGGKLSSNLELAKDPEIAAKVMVIGMRDGLFRADKNRVGYSLDRFINAENNDFYKARLTVNGITSKYPKSIAAANEIKKYTEELQTQIPHLIEQTKNNLPLTFEGSWSKVSQNVSKSSVLIKGSRGDAVRDLQSQLNALYPDKEPLETKTGIFGDQTKAAVEAFQKEHDLDVDGKAGKATFAKLAELLGKEKAADLPPIDLVAKSQPGVEGPATDRARLEADLVLAQAREAELQKQIADLAAKEAEKNQSPQKDFKIDLLEIANKTISLTVSATGISLNINGKDHDASCFNQLKSATTETESVYRNNSNTLLAKYEHGSDQFNIFQKNAYGADKVAVINDFSQQNAINLVGVEATKTQSLAQQKSVGTER